MGLNHSRTLPYNFPRGFLERKNQTSSPNVVLINNMIIVRAETENVSLTSGFVLFLRSLTNAMSVGSAFRTLTNSDVESRFFKLRTLGRGSYGKAHLVCDNTIDNGTVVVVKLTVVLDYCEAMETYGRIELLRSYGNLQSYWTTAKLWKLTVVLDYY
jgi:hypothetical protein